MADPPLSAASLADVESWIIALYEPRTPPATISRIQEAIQAAQKSPQGWQLAQQLLDRQTQTPLDSRFKFFGALTIIIKLNKESSTLSDDEATELLHNLIRWLTLTVSDGSDVLAIQKLCLALVTFFVYFSRLWPSCVRHVLLCLGAGAGRTVPLLEDGGGEATPTASELALRLDPRRLHVAVWFVDSLAQDVGKTDERAPRYMHAHQELAENAEAVVALLSVALSGAQQQHGGADAAAVASWPLQQEAIRALQSWILYAQRVGPGRRDFPELLRGLVDRVMACLSHKELYEPAADLFTDVLTNYSRFLTEGHYQSLLSTLVDSWGQQYYYRILSGDFGPNTVQFGLLMLAYGDARLHVLMEADDARSQTFLGDMVKLLCAAGYPVAEDTIFVPVLEFWQQYAEYLTDLLHGDERGAPAAADPKGRPRWKELTLLRLTLAVQNCYRKIQYPPIDEFMAWDSAERAGFADARKDVADLLQAVQTVAGSRPLLSMFADGLLGAVPARDWASMEAAAFCLAALADGVVDDEADDVLERVFAPALLDLLALGEAHLPVRLRQTALGLIERYSDYFERHADRLPAALALLFDAVHSPHLAGPSSKSIAGLCSSCRALLTHEAAGFLAHYQALRADPRHLDPLAEERIVSAIASIVQAVPDEGRRLHLFEQLLSLVTADAEQCLLLLRRLHEQRAAGVVAAAADLSSHPLLAKALEQCQPGPDGRPPMPVDALLHVAVHALGCLSGMAKGMRDTTDAAVLVVDLDAPDDDCAAPAAAAPPVAEPLARLQRHVMSVMVGIQDAFPRSGEAVETICAVLKAGFSETAPGPFVFPPDMACAFFARQGPATPRIGLVIATACSFVSSLAFGSSRGDPAPDAAMASLLQWLLSLLHGLPEVDADGEISQNGIEFMTRAVTKNPEVVLRVQPASLLESFFLLTLRILDGVELLPKQAAAEFWTEFLKLASPDPATQASIEGVTGHLGPLLALSLVTNIGGKASRSELDKLAEPLKKLVVRQVQARSWLEHALDNASFPSTQVSDQDKSIFLKRILK